MDHSQDTPQGFDFDFDFGGLSRSTLVDSARQTIHALDEELGAEEGVRRGMEVPGAPPAPGAPVPAGETVNAAETLLAELNEQRANFSDYVDIYPLREKNFTDHGLAVPVRFRELSKKSNFYWVRFPIFYQNKPNTPFNKIECALEFNPGEMDGYRRPRAMLLLPDRKFTNLLELSDSLSVKIGENFEFEAATTDMHVSTPAGTVGGKAGVDVATAGNLGLAVGPFTYTLKKAKVENSSPGAERVFWRVTGSEFFQESVPQFVVVLQVPKDVTNVRIAAALQAYSFFNLAAAGIGDVLRYLGERVASFFKAGAPVRDTQEWDISRSL
jgi:hypothetical protein